MTVHVGEVHTDVAGAVAEAPGRSRAESAPLGSEEAEWCRLQAQVEGLRARVAAEGFSD